MDIPAGDPGEIAIVSPPSRWPAWPQPGRLPRVRELDGWRGLSILFVLAAHMLPLGPARFQLNDGSARLGMSLFFTLSGFLITSTLIYHPNTRDFLIRRFFRIVPLAWLFVIIVLPIVHAPPRVFGSNFLFYSNLPPFLMVPVSTHLWSLCVEVHFYILVAVLFGFFGRKALYALPVLGLAVTLLRVSTGTYISIVSWLRVDEIFAGCTLALIYEGMLGAKPQLVLKKVPIAVWGVLLLISCHPSTTFFSYFRPYCAAALIGSTAFQSGSWWSKQLRTSWLAYIAGISYAVYVVHHAFLFGWFAPPSHLVKNLRRPIAFALTWAIAHLSTRYYESYWIAFGKRLIAKRPPTDAGVEEDNLRAHPASTI